MSALVIALKFVLSKFGGVLVKWLPMVMWEFLLDVFDEIMASFFEQWEAKVKATSEKADDRRYVMFKKWWDNFSGYSKKAA